MGPVGVLVSWWERGVACCLGVPSMPERVASRSRASAAVCPHLRLQGLDDACRWLLICGMRTTTPVSCHTCDGKSPHGKSWA